jgi:hypothetical protein
MNLKNDLKISREFEIQKYLSSMKALYETSILQNGEIYDIAFELTKGFSSITADSIIQDSRIIKILRYSIAPTISQMKFGQLFDLNSTEKFEKAKITRKERRSYETLTDGLGDAIAEFVVKHLDRSRFSWLDDSPFDLLTAQHFAKGWTCSLVADQNAQTAYRNWRKEQQELAVVSFLVREGYVKSAFGGVLQKTTDIGVGEYTKEIRVKGRTTQKADVVFRRKDDGRLILVEAKAVGVTLDATKRIKECCDKANDWTTNVDLKNPEIVAVIAGFFEEKQIENLQASNIRVVWEHSLDTLVS